MRIDDLRRSLTGVFERLGVSDADGLADLLVDAELRGHRDHGIGALAPLVRLYSDGTLNPRPEVTVLGETQGALLLDGDRGCGPEAPMRAMRWCIDRARELGGVATAAIRDWQIVVGAPYVRLAAEQGLIGFACTNFIPLMAPPGGRTPVLGTNPFAYGLPASSPVVLDVATTVVSRQKVRIATSLPEGLIFDAAGLPTTDPGAFASLAPLGSPHAPHKGFGLALVIDALSGVLTGSGFGRSMAAESSGAFLWALDVEAFLPRGEFLARMDELADQIRQGERAPGVDELVVPGERGERRLRDLTERGEVPIDDAGRQLLAAAGAELP